MKVKKLFVTHEGEFHPICDVSLFPALLNIGQDQMIEVFSHFCKFGTSGKIFGLGLATKGDLIEAQRKLEEVKLQNKKIKKSKKWLDNKKAKKRAKYGIS